jgi:hypothetical protein
MPNNKPKKPVAKSPPNEKPVKIPGSFDDLIRQSLAAKKPAKGWPKPQK